MAAGSKYSSFFEMLQGEDEHDVLRAMVLTMAFFRSRPRRFRAWRWSWTKGSPNFAKGALDERRWPYLIVDARYEKVRHAGRIVSRAALIAVGVNDEGRREILARSVRDGESEQTWAELFGDLKRRDALAKDLRAIFRSPEQALCMQAAKELINQWENEAPRVARQIEDQFEQCLAVLELESKPPPPTELDQHDRAPDARGKTQDKGRWHLPERRLMRPLDRRHAHRTARSLAMRTQTLHSHRGRLKSSGENRRPWVVEMPRCGKPWKTLRVYHPLPQRLDNPSGYPHYHNGYCC